MEPSSCALARLTTLRPTESRNDSLMSAQPISKIVNSGAEADKVVLDEFLRDIWYDECIARDRKLRRQRYVAVSATGPIYLIANDPPLPPTNRTKSTIAPRLVPPSVSTSLPSTLRSVAG